MSDPIDRILAEKRWLDEHPLFEQRPATIREFMTQDYLNIEKKVRPGIMEVLIDIFGTQIDPEWLSLKRRAVMTGGIGIGKTTFASIVLPYMVHWCYCLRDPQDYFGLMADSKIAFMMMSTSEKQAKEVLFGDVKARIDTSPWFRQYCKRDPRFENQVRFEKNLWILPGGSVETRFEGYNILGGVIDEGDSHKQTDRKDYAEEGYDTINSRIESRFMDDKSGKHRGILIVIGQTKSATGFMRKIYNECMTDPDAVAKRMSIWESKGWHLYTDNPDDAKNMRETGNRKSFIYDTVRKEIIPKTEALARGIDFTSKSNDQFIEVPTAYINGFIRNPVKALRDLAGIPPESADPFISLTHRIAECQDTWAERMGPKSPVNESAHEPRLEQWFRARDRLKRVLHVDMAYSAEGDALGMAMGHVPEVTDIDGEEKPLIVFDFLMRWHAAPGTEIILSDVRRIIYRLKFDLGFNLTRVTLDGFEGVDFRQQMARNKIPHETLSVDKKKMPYEDLRDAIYDGRCLFPKYMTKLNKGDTDTVNIAFKELSQLQDVGQKIDHPPNGSKDVADAMAGVVHYLMNDSQYRRGARRITGKQRTNLKTNDDLVNDLSVINPAPSLEDFLSSYDKSSPAELDIPKNALFDLNSNGPDEQTILSVDWSAGIDSGLPGMPW